MSENLLKSLSSMISPELLGSIGGSLGESQENVSKGIGAALPALLSAVVDKGSSQDGAKGLLDFIQNNNMDGSMLNNIGSLLGGGASDDFLNQGEGILGMLMGDKSSGVFSLLSSLSGMGKGSTNKLMKMLAPIIMSFIGKKVMSNGLGASGLMDLLSSQKDHLKGALPAGMGSALGLASGFANMLEDGKGAMDKIGNMAGASAKSAVSSGRDIADETKSKKWWPWLIALLVLLGLFYVLRSCGGTGIDAVDKVAEKTTDMVNEAADKTTQAANDAAESTGNAIKGLGDFVSNSTLNALSSISFATGSAGNQFYNWLKDGAEGEEKFAFNYLNFETGQANISEAGIQELSNFAKILQEIPEIKVEVSGHTDNTGSEPTNVAISKARAEAIKSQLVDAGVEASRIQANGYGSSQPKASNDTEEGRAENRRCEATVIYN